MVADGAMVGTEPSGSLDEYQTSVKAFPVFLIKVKVSHMGLAV
jgi:hypothetical protein